MKERLKIIVEISEDEIVMRQAELMCGNVDIDYIITDRAADGREDYLV